MLVQQNIYFFILSLTAIVAAIVAFAAWQRRSICTASNPFILMMLAIAGYATVAAMEAVVVMLPEKIFWSKLEYVGSGSVITFFLTFALHFTNKNRWLTPRNTALLWAIPTFNVALVATNEFHSLVWSGFLPDPNGSNVVIYQHGIGFIWVMVCVYVYTIAGIIILLKKALLPSVLYRQQSWIVLAGAGLPLLGASLYMLKITPPGLNITPMSFMFTGLTCFVNLFRFRMFDLLPVARDTLIEKMSDGVLVLDHKNRIVDINPAAKHLIGAKKVHIGQFAEQILPQLPEIVKLYQKDESVKTQIFIDAVTPRHVEILVSNLHNNRRKLTGYLITLRDITQQYQADLELRRANKYLQKQVIKIEKLQAQLREQAIRDGLTGLFNRRYFDETLPQELLRATRDCYSVAVMIMDIDYFKHINDTFGHQAGDRVLQRFGELLRQHSDSHGIVYRYGGEEFVLVFPDMTIERAFDHAEAIRLSFQAMRVQFVDQEISATVSAGLGVFPYHGETTHDLLAVVDQALYAAKLDGRNCIKYAQSSQFVRSVKF
ncbi:histidine kinase N-terminal 7TM domain-containing protein [Anabaena sp. CCY 0017]|uniref:histidine kinase N-terminal 7TM domain-containing diguanylate cyclase n=1 Tax=Anabaena sp. CCY 0017 TaxID=3103866 RepID=UPI0039C5EE94